MSPTGSDTAQTDSKPHLNAPPGCGDADVALQSSPMDISEISQIVPMGRMQSSHVTPTDHTYFRLNQTAEFNAQAQAVVEGGPVLPWDPQLDVFSPADGLLSEIGTFPFNTVSGFSGEVGDYRLIIWHSCTLVSIFIHLSELSQDILDITGEIKSGDHWFSHVSGQPVRLTSGQVIGKVGYHGFDYSLHDTKVLLTGFAVPEHYEGESWKVHTVDPFDYFADPVAGQLLDKVPRTEEPRGGKIDYDIDGRLVGNWFLDGTVDYAGRVDPAACEGYLCNYWSGHLAIAYDHIDPSQIRISIGRETGIDSELCRGCLGVYAVRSGSPDPAQVSVATGLVKYELLATDFIDRVDGQVRTKALEDAPLGVFLVELTDDRTIRTEVIPGASPDHVSGFSDAALIYRR